jgi:histidinol-phosphate aminotransferase
MNKQLNLLLRENIKAMAPYSSARDEFTGEASVYLDANENPFQHKYSRYPDPVQTRLKKRIGEINKLDIENIFIGNGSDEIIDLLIRAFCVPGQDSILSLNPSYGMYKVSAAINDIKLDLFNLGIDFELKVDDLISKINQHTKIIFLCSPNNPSGNDFDGEDIIKIVDNFNGIVVVDEAYKDFSSKPSLIDKISKYNNLLIMQTLSKAYGVAALRLGLAFANKELLQILNKIKPPYNINQASQELALDILYDLDKINLEIFEIKRERDRMYDNLSNSSKIEKVFKSEANFLLVKVKNASDFYHYFMKNGIILRNRHGQYNCDNCIRITIGTKEENDIFFEKLKQYND